MLPLRHLIWAIALLASPARADVAVSYAPSGAACVPEPVRLFVQGSLLRIDTESGGMDYSMVYDGVEQLATQIDHAQRLVHQVEMDEDAIDFQTDVAHATGNRMDKEMDKAEAMMAQAQEQMAAQCAELERQGMACPQMPDMSALMQPGNADAMLAQQQQAMAQVDPAQLEAMGVDPEQMRRQQAQSAERIATNQRRAGTQVVTDLGHDRVAGLDCAIRELRRGDEVIERTCEAQLATLGLDARDQRGLERGWRQLLKFAGAYAPLQDKLADRFGGARSEVDAERGLPLRKTCFEGGRESGATEIRFGRAPLDDSVFTVPAGYRPAGQGTHDGEP